MQFVFLQLMIKNICCNLTVSSLNKQHFPGNFTSRPVQDKQDPIVHTWLHNVKTRFSLKHQCGNRFCLHKRVNWRTGKNSKTLWERPFPGDTRWLREGTESLTPAEYPWDNDHNRTWVQRRSLIQDYTAGRVTNITHQNTPKARCNEDATRT